MTQTITTMLAQTLALTGSVVMTVDDNGAAGRTATVQSSGTKYYRVLLAETSIGALTVANPTDLLYVVQTALNAGPAGAVWAVAINSSGFVAITYSGTGTGTITWSGTTLRNVLGFTGNLTFASPPVTVTATYHPTHVVYSISRANSTGWIAGARPAALAEMRTGEVYAWMGDAAVRTQAFESQWHPRDWTMRTTQSALATPRSPDASAWSRSDYAAGQLYPWSVEDFLFSVHSIASSRVGAALGTFADVRSGSSTAFQVVSVAAETLQNPQWTPAVPSWDAYYHVKMRLRWITDDLRI